MQRILKLASIAAIAGLGTLGLFNGWYAFAAGGTALCKTAEAPCATTNHYSTGTKLNAAAGFGMITTSVGNIGCGKWTITGPTTSTGSSTESVTFNIETFLPVGCAIATPFSDHTCTTTVLNAPFKGTISHTSGTSGNLTIASGGSGNLAIKVNCGASLLKCEFSFGTPVLDISSGTPWDFYANREALTGTPYEGGTCPKEASWWGHFNAAQLPSTMWIEESA
jgi:hypothetical protein